MTPAEFRDWMARRGWTQTAVARATGFSRRAIVRHVRGLASDGSPMHAIPVPISDWILRQEMTSQLNTRFRQVQAAADRDGRGRHLKSEANRQLMRDGGGRNMQRGRSRLLVD